jgi:UDP-glucose 4-epimerase
VIDGARVLVTGGGGTVGSAIVDAALANGAAEVVVLDRFDRGRADNLADATTTGRLRVVEGDIRDPDVVTRTVEGVDIVFHQAGLRVTACAADPRAAFEVMAGGGFNVFDAAARAGVRKVVAASSAVVYGDARRLPVDEEHPTSGNRTLYGALKVLDEGVLRSFHETAGLDYLVLRYFNVYGPRMSITGPHTEVLVRWMERIASGEPPMIEGDGLQTYDFVHVADVARANLLAATSNATDEVCNVASGVETSLRVLAETLLEAMDSDLAPVHVAGRTVNSVARRVGGTTKAGDLLGFRAEIPLDVGLRHLVHWWRTSVAPSLSFVGR